MWIETHSHHPHHPHPFNSFASNGECGLKQLLVPLIAALLGNSFASNGECGLKRCGAHSERKAPVIHSPAMANVD